MKKTLPTLSGKIVKTIFSLMILVMLFSLIIAPQVNANTILDGLTNSVQDTEFRGNKTNLPEAIGSIIQILLGFLGVIAVVLIIFAGFLWLTAGGDDTKITKAKNYIKNAVIGIVIILSSYIITSYVISQISTTLR